MKPTTLCVSSAKPRLASPWWRSPMLTKRCYSLSGNAQVMVTATFQKYTDESAMLQLMNCKQTLPPGTGNATKKQFMLVTAAGQRLAMKSAYPPRVRTSMYQLLTRQVLSPVLIQYPTTRNYVFSVIIKLCSNNLYTCSQQRMQASH